MAGITDAQKKENAKNEVKDRLIGLLTECGAEQVGTFVYAIPTIQDGQEVWVEIDFTAKQWKPTKISQAYDPFAKAQEWREDVATKEQEKAQKLAEKAAKIKRDTVARAKAKAEKTD